MEWRGKKERRRKKRQKGKKYDEVNMKKNAYEEYEIEQHKPCSGI